MQPVSIGIIFPFEIGKGHTKDKAIYASVIAVIRNPLLVATVAGLLVSAFDVTVPVPLARFCELLGDAFIPCALFAAGLFVSRCEVKGELGEISWLVFVKLILHR